MEDLILILDFGSQYTHLIKAVLRKISVYSQIEPADFDFGNYYKKYSNFRLKGIIFSGGAQSVNNNRIKFGKEVLSCNVPILGICYGHQLLAKIFNGKVETIKKEFGEELLTVNSSYNSELLKGIKNKSIVWMSHEDSVVILPGGFIATAATENSQYAVIEDVAKKVYGIQFHPEVSHTSQGLKILDNFCKGICKVKEFLPWDSKVWIIEAKNIFQKSITKNKVLVAVSGGVDSLTMVALLRKFLPKKQLLAVYIDTGLMPDETQIEVEQFCKDRDINLLVKNLSIIFLDKLKGIKDPSQKGKIIGNTFIKEFEKISLEENIDFFAQGTIWSDVIESGVTKFSSQIKPHHNVSGLPKKMRFKLIEPLRELFKDQVREVARELNLPLEVVEKKVFPGPGFAIRIDGVVTREKVKIVKKCTKIIEDILFSSNVKSKIWMAFAILINVSSLGVKGDKKIKNKYAIVVRVVESKNSLTANFSESVYSFLNDISSRIVKETDVGRVVYDITNKPPATIEWQ